MTTNTKQSYSESDEVFTGSGRYPCQDAYDSSMRNSGYY